MKPLSDLLKHHLLAPKSKAGDPRALLLEDFLHEINKDREANGYLKYPPRLLGIKLAHLNLEDLRWLYDKCKGAKNFSKYFFWSIKI